MAKTAQDYAPPPKWLGINLVRNRWIFPLIGAIMTALGGAAYAFSVFVTPLEAEFGWARADTVLAFSVAMFVFGIFMTVGGYFVDKLGPRIPFIIGSALMASSQLLASRVETIFGLVLTYGVILGAGIGIAYTSSTIALSSRWYPDKEKKGLAIGVSVLGFGLGATIAAPLWTAGIAAYGWQTTYAITGVVFAVVLFTLATIIQFPPTNYHFVEGAGWQPGAAKSETKVAVNPEDLTFAEAVRSPYLWLTGLLFFLTIFGGLMTTSQLAAYARTVLGAADPGLDTAAIAALAATVVMAMSIFNGFGRPAWGWLTGKIGPRTALTLSPLVMALAMVVLANANDRLTVTIGAALTGLAFGGTLAMNPIMATALFGASFIARIYGFIFFLGFGFGGFFGPRVGGMIYDATGQYQSAFMTSAALAVGAAVLARLLYPAFGKEKQSRPAGSRVTGTGTGAGAGAEPVVASSSS